MKGSLKISQDHEMPEVYLSRDPDGPLVVFESMDGQSGEMHEAFSIHKPEINPLIGHGTGAFYISGFVRRYGVPDPAELISGESYVYNGEMKFLIHDFQPESQPDTRGQALRRVLGTFLRKLFRLRYLRITVRIVSANRLGS